jgi:hypothetical protein
MTEVIQDDSGLLQRLAKAQVEFLIIGGFCGIIHGVSLVTKDLDICCQFTKANLYRLEAAVKDLHPFHRLVANKLPFELNDYLCSQLKNVYLQTDLGKLDCLSEVKGIGSYDECIKRSTSCKLSYCEFRMLDIDALIAAKEAVGRERDLAAVKLLLAIKEEKSKRIQTNQ